jgi:hypothetical protein
LGIADVQERGSVLAGELGGGLYRKRKAMVEPVFAQTKHNRRINQFQAARYICRTLGVAANHRDSQPDEAPQAPPGHPGALKTPLRCTDTRPGAQTPTSTNTTALAVGLGRRLQQL